MFAAIFDVMAKNPNKDYDRVGAYVGNILTILQTALGNYDFGVL